MTLIFFGSSDFSLPALKACLDAKHQVLAVVTTPDQKKGRGLHVQSTPVKAFAEEKGLLVETPESLKDAACYERIKALKPDIFVVSSYGKFIPSNWLKIPSQVSLNVHPSLLPKYRGASPVNQPILNGDSETGVTIAEVTHKLDAGDIFAQIRYELDPKMDSEKLSHQLAGLSYDLLRQVLEQVKTNRLKRIVQEESKASYASKLTKEQGLLSFERSSEELDRQIRGLKPWPGTYILFQGSPLQVLAALPEPKSNKQKPGTFLGVESDGSVLIAVGKGALKLIKVKPAGKNEMTASDFVRGRRLAPGFVF